VPQCRNIISAVYRHESFQNYFSGSAIALFYGVTHMLAMSPCVSVCNGGLRGRRLRQLPVAPREGAPKRGGESKNNANLYNEKHVIDLK